MSVDPISNVVASAAGSRLAHAAADVERSEHGAQAQKREIAAQERAEQAAGIPATDGESLEPHQRDADGRRPWEIAARDGDQRATGVAPVRAGDRPDDRGNLVDLVG